jgi:hypothetical protein
MENRNIMVIVTLMLLLMVSVFAVSYNKSGKPPAQVVGLIVVTCLPPVGMILYTNRNRKR